MNVWIGGCVEEEQRGHLGMQRWPPLMGGGARRGATGTKFNQVISLPPSPPQVQDTSFILCIVYMQPEIPVKQLKNLNTAPSSKLLYHRLDLLGQPSSCLHFKQLATVGKTRQPQVRGSCSGLCRSTG